MDVQKKIIDSLNSKFSWFPHGLNEFIQELEKENHLDLDFEEDSGDRWLRYFQDDNLVCLVHFKKPLVFVSDKLNINDRWNDLISIVFFSDSNTFAFSADKIVIESLNEFACGDIIDFKNINLNDLWVITL